MDDMLRGDQDQSNDISEKQEQVVSSEQVTPEDLDTRWLRWKCLACGYLYEGVNPIKVCPKCGNEDPDKFDDAN
jgi:rubrerythrin